MLALYFVSEKSYYQISYRYCIRCFISVLPHTVSSKIRRFFSLENAAWNLCVSCSATVLSSKVWVHPRVQNIRYLPTYTSEQPCHFYLMLSKLCSWCGIIKYTKDSYCNAHNTPNTATVVRNASVLSVVSLVTYLEDPLVLPIAFYC